MWYLATTVRNAAKQSIISENPTIADGILSDLRYRMLTEGLNLVSTSPGDLDDIYDYRNCAELKIIGDWKDDIAELKDPGFMFPGLNQSYLNIEYKGEKYEAYLRWKREDPWECYFGGNLYDIFLHYNRNFKYQERELAKDEALRLFLRFFHERELSGTIG